MTANSSGASLRLGHVRLVAAYWMRFSMRTGGGLMTVLVVLVAGLSIAAIFATPIEALLDRAPGLGHSPAEAASDIDRIARSGEVSKALEWITGAKTSQIEYLQQRQPALLSAILLAMLIALPFIVCLGAFNQTSGDIANRGLRYLLLRTERPNIFLGRFVGTMLFLAAALAGLLILLVAYIGIKLNVYPAGELTLWSFQGYVAFIALAFPYVAMCAWISGAIDSPFGALVLCWLLVGFPVLFIKVANAALDGKIDWLERALPWGWKYDLLSGDVATRLVAYAAMAGFTALFLFIGLRSFKKREL